MPDARHPGQERPARRGAGVGDLVEAMRAQGKDVDYLMFEDEGHDVLKLPNKVRCYETIVDFFKKHL